MYEENPEFDVFLNCASEDTEWCKRLAKCLCKKGVRVCLDKCKLESEDNLSVQSDDGLEKSRKMIAVWSPDYFQNDNIWTRVGTFSLQHFDLSSKDRTVIPLLIKDCDIEQTLRNTIYIDFRKSQKFELKVKELIETLEKSRYENFPCNFQRIETSYEKVKTFGDEIANLYSLIGFEVKKDIENNILHILKKTAGTRTKAIVNYKEKPIKPQDHNRVVVQRDFIRVGLSDYDWTIISSEDLETRIEKALKESSLICLTYLDLLRELGPLDDYVDGLISDFKEFCKENWQGEDRFIEPYLLTDTTEEQKLALDYINKWLYESENNLLMILGNLGTGKTTLLRNLADGLAKKFLDDPLHNPVPVLIPFRELGKEFSLDNISKYLNFNFQCFEYLFHRGKIILLFDAFDEMNVRSSNFNKIKKSIAKHNGKVILTCRTHYFKDHNEISALIDKKEKFNQSTKDLYESLTQQSSEFKQLDAEVVYLQEFDDKQVKEYLCKVLSDTADEDWNKIKKILYLSNMKQFPPLLLNIIVSELGKKSIISFIDFYKRCTQKWFNREQNKHSLLDKSQKVKLMQELAWCMWREKERSFDYGKLTSFVEKLIEDKVIELGDKNLQDVVNEIHTATFLKRDRYDENFSFIHRPFMKYFLACKIFKTFKEEEFNIWSHRDKETYHFLLYLKRQAALENLEE